MKFNISQSFLFSAKEARHDILQWMSRFYSIETRNESAARAWTVNIRVVPNAETP